MQALLRSSRIWLALIFLAVSAQLSAASAQSAPATELAWQKVITQQIQAFRDRDAKVALSFAGAAFQTRFSSPEEFFAVIMGSGYAPIMESQSHSFGLFQKIDDRTVAQLVRLVGVDQKLFEAVYVMGEEMVGWRVQGVRLAYSGGVGI
ncbi:MAG: DUF4864 domain-containing protein [Hyphomicrobiales bacterium]|nr:MAG: DUF4864 domain-containing protein [Hyphomicrobiales bacterium]